MGWEHGTYGWDQYDSFVRALTVLEIPFEEIKKDDKRSVGPDRHEEQENLRFAKFTHPDGREMLCEEYLVLDDGDCDGRSLLGIAVYEVGKVPVLFTKVIDGGHDRYPPLHDREEKVVRDFLYSLTEGTVQPLPPDEVPPPVEPGYLLPGHRPLVDPSEE